MIDKGVDTIIEIGPGKGVGKFVNKIDKSIKVISIDSVDDYKEAVSYLKGENDEQ